MGESQDPHPHNFLSFFVFYFFETVSTSVDQVDLVLKRSPVFDSIIDLWKPEWEHPTS